MVLVTGSTGLTGSHLLFLLLEKGFKVKALVRTQSSKNKILQTFKYYVSPETAQEMFNKIIWEVGDMVDYFSLAQALDGVTKVYHTAALVSFSSRRKKDIFYTNVEGTATLVNLCLEKNIEKLCFVSSIAALGNSENGEPVSEATLWKPIKKEAAYSLSKTKSELEIWRGITEGLNAVIVNPSVILGPGQWTQGSSQLFTSISNGFRFYTNGGTGVVDVRDVARAMVTLMESDICGERFVVSGQNIAYFDLFAQIAASLNVKAPDVLATPKLTYLAWAADAVRSLLTASEPKITRNSAAISHKKLNYSAQKIKEKLNFEFTPLSETITHTAKCYLLDNQ